MNREKLKRQVLHQSGEALGQFLATSMVAIVQHDERGFKDYGSGTCVYYRDQYLIKLDEAMGFYESRARGLGPINTGLQAGAYHGKDVAVSTASLRGYSLIDGTVTARRQKPLKRLSYLSAVRHRPEGRC